MNCRLEKEIKNNKVVSIKCIVCKKHEDRLKVLRSFTPVWVHGSKSVKKDSVKKHLKSEVHTKALDLELKTELNPVVYNERVIKNTPIGRGLVRMGAQDKEMLRVCFNSIYCILKQERPYTDYPGVLELQFKNGIKKFQSYNNDRAGASMGDVIGKVLKEKLLEELSKANYYCLLTDGSTDAGVVEQELLYVLLLIEGRPRVKFFSIESPNHVNAEGLKDTIKVAFERSELEYTTNLFGLNVDGASVNTGLHNGFRCFT